MRADHARSESASIAFMPKASCDRTLSRRPSLLDTESHNPPIFEQLRFNMQ
jgi:hypothetical protein